MLTNMFDLFYNLNINNYMKLKQLTMLNMYKKM